MEINLIIRELLAKHSYISLPGIGSFTQKYEPAHPSADGKSFVSPKQIVSFDASRTFNDEAIENYLCDTMGVSHADANDLLNSFTDRLKDDLNNGKSFLFENVGTLSKDKKGKIQFEQAKELEAALSTYGLNDVGVTKATSSKSNINRQSAPLNTNVKESSSTKALVGISAIIVIAALTASFILIPEFRFWEKYINTSDNTIEPKSNTIKLENNLTQAATLPDSSLQKKDSISIKVDQKLTNSNIKRTALYYEEPKIQSNKMYYLIVGSFVKLENAQKLLEKYRQKSFNPEIIQGNSMFRVSISKTTDKTRAISEFNQFRANNPNESIWLLGQ